MLKLDTVKFKVDNQSIDSIDLYNYWRKPLHKGDVYYDTSYSINPNLLGLKSIQHQPDKDKTIIEISAKILGLKYGELININTIEESIKRINDTNLINLNINKALDSAMLLRCDATENLRVSKDVQEYLDHAHRLRVNTKYQVDEYKMPKNSGVVFKGKQSSFRERQIMYDKFKDMVYNKSNQELRQIMTYPQIEKHFKGVLRVESNFASLAKIREYMSTDSLVKALESNSNPNLRILDKITSKVEMPELFNMYDDLALRDVERRIGREGIIKHLKYDMGLINKYLSTKVKGNISRYKASYRDILYEMLQSKDDTNQPGKKDIYIEEIRQLLKAS
jgi:DNA-binding phage protein